VCKLIILPTNVRLDRLERSVNLCPGPRGLEYGTLFFVVHSGIWAKMGSFVGVAILATRAAAALIRLLSAFSF
jgi:hypothetical protein